MVRACCSSVRPAWVGVTPWRPRTSERGAERLLHVADARRGRGQRQMGAFRAVGDAAGIHHVAEQAEIGQIETHDGAARDEASFFAKEAYAKILIAQLFFTIHIRITTKPGCQTDSNLVNAARWHSLRSALMLARCNSPGDPTTVARMENVSMAKAPAERPLSPHLFIYSRC